MDPNICPPWWPRLLWEVHFLPRPHGIGPVNYPPVIEDIMASLTIHTMSYRLLDQEEAQRIRGGIEQTLSKTMLELSNLHEANQASA